MSTSFPAPNPLPTLVPDNCSTGASGKRQRVILLCLIALPALAVGLWLRMTKRPWEGSLARKATKGIPLKFEELIHVQLWWAGAVVCGLLALALLTSFWWMKWARFGTVEPAPPVLFRDPGSPGVGAALWRRSHRWLLLALVGLALMVRLPRMERGIDRDEQDTMHRSMIGYININQTGGPVGKPVIHPWKMTVWECSQCNNPFLFSIAARCTLRTWQACTGAEPWRISLSALRLPALLAGLLGLVVLVRIGGIAGSPALGLLAGLLGALHPMHVEFSTQARGYGMVLLFVPLAMAGAWQGLRTGRWRHWMTLGGSLLGLLSANPGSIYFAASLGICLTAFLLWRLRRDPRGAALTALTRWLLCSVLAGILYLPLILPALPQAMAFLKNMKGALDGMWVQITWAWYGAGICYPPMEIATPWLKSGKKAWDFMRQGYFQTEPLTALLLVTAVPLLLWCGARWWWKQPGFRPLLVASIAAPLTAYFAHRSADSPFLYHWYLIYWLPPALLLNAAALQQAGYGVARHWKKPGFKAVPALAYLMLFVFTIKPGQGRILWTRLPPGPEVYDRGRYRLTTYPDGITTRLQMSPPSRSREPRQRAAEMDPRFKH